MLREVDAFCYEFGCSSMDAEARLASVGESENVNYLSLVYFSAISFMRPDIERILEIGTYEGKATRVLAKLFPGAQVNTVDLPESSIRKIGPRIASRYLDIRNSAKFKENTGRPNIRFFASDSFFLPSLALPREFDLIYVDGSHRFPAVAWDISYAYNSLSPGGFMFAHDYCPDNDVKRTVDYMAKIVEDVRLLPFDYGRPERKIAYVRKE